MILLTGGLGYLGSHMAAQLLERGQPVVLLDNLSNSTLDVKDRLETLCQQAIPFERVDVRDRDAVKQVFARYPITAVVHFAGLKSVNESVQQPLAYYDHNVNGLVSLLSVMAETNVRTLVFSSTAAIYGEPQALPIPESAALSPVTPYGHSKLMCEQVLRDVAHADGLPTRSQDVERWKIAILRYFNPAGAHPSGLIGEIPQGIPNNLVPYIAQVACGERAYLSVFGQDYATVDGTGVRDYIHVQDLIAGHVAALQWLSSQASACEVFNLGRGEGVSVLQMLHAFSEVVGRPLPYEIVARRQGDCASVYADAQRAEQLLSWRATRNVLEMAEDTWRFYRALKQADI